MAAVFSIEADEGVDFEVSEVEVDVDRVETDEEVDKGVLLTCRNVREEGRRDGLTRGECGADGEVQGERLGIDIADVNTTLVGEENGVAFTLGGDADIILGV